MAKKQIVPFTRAIKMGQRGQDVRAVKRALVHQGVLDQKLSKVTNSAGKSFRSAVKQYQKRHDLRQTGTYTKATHEKLRAGGHFDSYGAHLMRSYAPARAKKSSTGAKGIASAALYAHSKQPRHYTQGAARWQPVSMVPWQQHMWAYGDCSSFATGCFKMAGLPDPNGMGYRAGYTGTLCQHGKAVTTPQPGDLLFFGSGPPWTHVAVAVSSTRCVSHGSEGGPYLVPINYRPDQGQIRRYV